MAKTRRALEKSLKQKKNNRTNKNNKKNEIQKTSGARELQSNKNQSINLYPSNEELLKLCTPLTVRLTRYEEVSDNQSK